MRRTLADRLTKEIAAFGRAEDMFPGGMPLDDFVWVPFRDAGSLARINGSFGAGCHLVLTRDLLHRLKTDRALHLLVNHFGSKAVIEEATVLIASMTGQLSLSIGHENSLVAFGRQCRGQFDVRLWRDARLLVGDATTCNGERIVVDDALVAIGCDGLLSDEILIQSSDQHGIVDLARNRIINNTPNLTVIQRHVWIGRRAVLMPNIRIGAGSVIGACALVTKDIPSKVIAAGAPAVVLKSGHTWSRWPDRYDPMTQAFIRDHFQAAPSLDLPSETLAEAAVSTHAD